MKQDGVGGGPGGGGLTTEMISVVEDYRCTDAEGGTTLFKGSLHGLFPWVKGSMSKDPHFSLVHCVSH